MKLTTRYFLGIAVASALAIGASSGVLARGGRGPGWGGYHGMMGEPARMRGPFGGSGMMTGGDPVVVADQRLTQLETRLGVTPEQEGAWNAYTDAVKGKAGLMTAHRQARFSGMVSPEQRLSFHQEGLAQMRQVTDTSSGLDAVLSPEQQANAGNLV